MNELLDGDSDASSSEKSLVESKKIKHNGEYRMMALFQVYHVHE